MAFIRNLMFLTFDQNDTFNEKKDLRDLFIKQGFQVIAETKEEPSGIVKEWILSGPVQYGKFAPEHSNVSDIMKFKP